MRPDPAFLDTFCLRYNWTILLPTELSAAAILIEYWTHSAKLNPAWISICLVVVVIINMFGAGVYGEAEFIFAYAFLHVTGVNDG